MNAEGANGAPPACTRLRLFVAGNTQHSQRAIENLHAICARRLSGPVDLDLMATPPASRHGC